MADATIDNGDLGNLEVSSKTLSSGAELQGIELVTAVEGGARTDLAKQIGIAQAGTHFGLIMLGVRKDAEAALASDGQYHPFLVDQAGRVHVNIGEAVPTDRVSDSISAALAVDRLMNNLTPLVPARAAVAASASGANSLLGTQGAGKQILVHQMMLIPNAAVTARVESSGGNDLSGDLNLDAKSGFVLPFSPFGWFITVANEGLSLNLGTTVYVGGTFGYTVLG